jgi:peptidoglycan/LPS O-acetylase OafA/YrhL
VSVAYKLWAIGRVEVDTTAAGPLLFPLPNFLDQFAIGMGLAVASIAVEAGLVSTRAVALLRRRSSLSWLAALALFAIAGAMTGGTGLGGAAANESEVLLRHGLHGLIALAVVLPAVTTTGPQGSAQRMLALRTLQWLGLISYSIYLWHGLIELEVIKRIGQPEGFAASAGTLLLVCGATIAVAAVSFYAIERPALGLRRLVPDRGRAQRGARAPAAEAAAARVELARSEP